MPPLFFSTERRKIMKRYSGNPIVKRTDIPVIKPHLVDVTSVFNPGAIKINDTYYLMLRVQNRGRRTFSVMAQSKDGINFDISNKIVKFDGIEKIEEKIYHCYDPRITRINDTFYIMFAMDMEKICRLGLAQTKDFEQFEFLGIVSAEDNRNGVLFPEKIDGKYLRFDRPNKVALVDGPVTGSEIHLSESTDLLNWEAVAKIAEGNHNYWDELIGAGPPPVKTKKGWLLVYHGIAMHYQPIYQAGVMLLDLENPAKIIARGKLNILEPREIYETVGQVPNVIFPTGMTVDNYDENGFAKMESKVHIYYGAADTSIGLAISTIKKLIEKCYQ